MSSTLSTGPDALTRLVWRPRRWHRHMAAASVRRGVAAVTRLARGGEAHGGRGRGTGRGHDGREEGGELVMSTRAAPSARHRDVLEGVVPRGGRGGGRARTPPLLPHTRSPPSCVADGGGARRRRRRCCRGCASRCRCGHAGGTQRAAPSWWFRRPCGPVWQRHRGDGAPAVAAVTGRPRPPWAPPLPAGVVAPPPPAGRLPPLPVTPPPRDPVAAGVNPAAVRRRASSWSPALHLPPPCCPGVGGIPHAARRSRFSLLFLLWLPADIAKRM